MIRRRVMVLMLCLSLVLGQFSAASAAPQADHEDGGSQILQKNNSETADSELNYKEDEVIIVYKDKMADTDKVEKAIEKNSLKTLNDTEQVMAELNITEQEEIPASKVTDEGTVAVVSLPDDVSVDQAIRELEQTDQIAYVQKNYLYQAQSVNVNDEKKGGAYYLEDLRLPQAWELSRADESSYNKSGTPVTVAVLDTGINYDKAERNEDMQDVSDGGNIWYSYAYDACQNKKMSEPGTDWLDATGPYTDYVGHGTRVASLIGAATNNGAGMSGVSYNGRVLPVNIFDEPLWDDLTWIGSDDLYGFTTYAPTSAIIAAYEYIMEYADELNIKVINMSFESPERDDLVAQCVEEAYEKGILSVAAAGNYLSYEETGKAKAYPASYKYVLSVASVDFYHDQSTFSRYNNAVDICAPGEYILMAAGGYAYNVNNERMYWYKKTGYTNSDAAVNGTSFASPIVAGIAALVYAADPDMTPARAIKCLTRTATDLGEEGKDVRYGYGLVNAYASVQKAQGNDVDSKVKTSEEMEYISAKAYQARKITRASLSVDKYVYNGEARKPKVTVRFSGRIIADHVSSSTDNVKIAYDSGRKKVGTYTVKISGRKSFNGSVTKSFKIIPRATSILSSVGKEQGFRVRWKERIAQVDGYQIQYSTQADMSDAKTSTVRKNTTTAKSINDLESGQTYYVRVRTYKKVNGKNYFSNWSDKISIHTK